MSGLSRASDRRFLTEPYGIPFSPHHNDTVLVDPHEIPTSGFDSGPGHHVMGNAVGGVSSGASGNKIDSSNIPVRPASSGFARVLIGPPETGGIYSALPMTETPIVGGGNAPIVRHPPSTPDVGVTPAF